MTSPNDPFPAVDAVIPVYGERREALDATLAACVQQTHPFSKIIVVDDGSPEAVRLPEWAQGRAQISLHRLAENQGISAARNAGMALAAASVVACINTEVLPDPDWLASCLRCLNSQPKVGACYARLVSATPDRLLTRWRMRFLETKFGEQSGSADFAPGHAVLFRREALAEVRGYDERFRVHHEDADICHRMRQAGWETYYLATSRCLSIQKDSLEQIAGKELRDTYWYSPQESSLARLYFHLTKWTLVRAGRNLVTGRLSFLPLDGAIWAAALWMATLRTAAFLLRRRP